ncbi:MAG: alpha/beta hydrolase [Oscillospiraceae bacterium]|nr:alpha/beta hydrolase [Oscillospiraceae bacterium]
MAVKILVAVLCVSAGAFALYLAVGAFFFGQLLTRRAANRGFNQLPDEDVLLGKAGAHKKQETLSPWERLVARVVGDASGLEDFYNKPYYPSFFGGIQWFFGNKPKKITMDSPRGERLHADMFLNEKPSDVWFICLHGYTSCPRDFGGAAKIYHDDWGCNVLLPYLCAHGDSESKYVSMGWLDRIDIAAWIDYLVREYDHPQIVLHGVSMGAAAAMMTTGEDLPPNVACAIADCGYTSFWDEYVLQAKVTLRQPAFPGVYALNTVVRRRLGFSMKEASCVEQLKKSKTPTLFIHGEDDEFVPFWMLDQVYGACAAEKGKLLVANAGHAEACYQLELYYGAIKEFAGRYLKGHAFRESV